MHFIQGVVIVFLYVAYSVVVVQEKFNIKTNMAAVYMTTGQL